MRTTRNIRHLRSCLTTLMVQLDGSLLQEAASDRRFKNVPQGAATTIWS
jgi:hypothetical protein